MHPAGAIARARQVQKYAQGGTMKWARALSLILLSLVLLLGWTLSARPKTPTNTTLESHYVFQPCTLTSDNTSCASVTFYVTVSPKGLTGTPTGTIDFKDRDTVLGTVLLGSENTTYGTFDLSVGTHEITAAYGGDASFAGSTSATIAVKVRNWTETTLTSSDDPSTNGKSVTFTATVSPISGTGTPTGTVTFFESATAYNGAFALGTSTLSFGQANYTTSSLSVGVHNIHAVYSGDASFECGSSSDLMQTVN